MTLSLRELMSDLFQARLHNDCATYAVHMRILPSNRNVFASYPCTSGMTG